MTSESGAVYDLEYRRYEGERSGRAAIVLAMVLDGVRKVLGLRRKARRKILPWLLIAIAVVPAIAVVGFGVITEGFGGADQLADDLLPDHAEYFGFVYVPTLIFIAFSAPELLIPDRVNNMLTIYGSRPLTRYDYLLARIGALAIVVLTFLLLPQLVLYIGDAILSGDLVGFFTGNLDLLWQIPSGALIVFVAQATVAFLIAAFATRPGIAGGIYLAGSFIVQAATFGLATEVNKWFAVFDLNGHSGLLLAELFNRPDLREGSVLHEVDLGWELGAVVLVVVVAITAVALHYRYRNRL